MEFEFKVFTLNCWGIPVVSRDRLKRMQAIADYLSEGLCYDVVCLQEVWSESDFCLIKTKAAKVYPYSHYFYSGVVGSGVCILSRHQIEEVFFHQWPVNGYAHKVQHGDWFGGKGVGLCRLALNGRVVNVYSAHLHAEYDRKSDSYIAHRVLQAYDTAKFIDLTSQGADLVILAGDLNTESSDLAYRILNDVIGLKDSFVGAGRPDLRGTHECLHNTYRDPKSDAKRIDYVMFCFRTSVLVKTEQYVQPLPDLVPGLPFSYSDHEAVAVTLSLARSDFPHCQIDYERSGSVLMDSIQVCENALVQLRHTRTAYWFLAGLLFVLLTIVITSIEAAPGYVVLLRIMLAVLTFFLSFAVVMALLWNRIETNAVVAGKLGMEINLKKCEEQLCRPGQ